jgi:glyoxylase-like metal-dependent hydrolase (beta-lactamase superfamily II)
MNNNKETSMTLNPIQLFDTESSTYTYILSADGSNEAVIIDPVERHWERDLQHIERLGLQLAYILETHVHADHVTGAGKLRAMTGAKTAVPSGCGVPPAELQLNDGDVIGFGAGEQIRVLHTPGHTAGSVCYVWRDNVFTGDTLLINGCGRTDFQSGSADALYDSVTNKLFTLPDTTRMWPAHDYKGQSLSTIGWEKRHNARLTGRTRAEFIDVMEHLHLPPPKMIDIAVPANRNLGLPHGG